MSWEKVSLLRMVGIIPSPYGPPWCSKPSWLEMVWDGPEYGDPTVDDGALGIEGTDPDEIRAGGSSWNCCMSCFMGGIGAVANMDGFSKYEYGRGWKLDIGSTGSYGSMVKSGNGACMLCSSSYICSRNCCRWQCSKESIV
jgi:hypothetical protein